MTESSYPYDAGAGTAVDEAAWRAMSRLWLPSGVIGASTRDGADTSLLPSLGSGGAGPIFQMAAGEAWNSGIKYVNDATVTKTASANGNTNPRIDRLALKLDTTANTLAAVTIEGTPAASPVSPTMPDTSTAIHVPIARATCPGSASAQNYSSLVDERLFVGGRLYVGPSTGAGVAGAAGFQNGDEWLQTDTKDRLLRLGSTWVGTRPREYAGVPTTASGTAHPAANAQTTFARIDVPAMGYAYQISFSAHLQMSLLGSDNFVEGRIRQGNASTGTVLAGGSEFARGGLDAPLSIPKTKPFTIAAGSAISWFFTVTNNVGTGEFGWASTDNWFAATLTPIW